MPRQVRIEYPDAFYHVMARGDRRENIYHNKGARKTLIALAVKQETAVSLMWVAERLEMGVNTGVSRYAGRTKVEVAKSRKQAKLLNKMTG